MASVVWYAFGGHITEEEIEHEVREAIAAKLNATDKAAIEFTNAIADEVRPAPPITPAGGSTITDILSRYTSDILFERTTPEKAARPFIDELSSSLRK